MINAGRSLYEVQKLLGHTQVKTTQRYAHLSHDSLLSAADTAATAVPWDRETREGEGKETGQTKAAGQAKALPAGKIDRPARQRAQPRNASPGQTVSPPPSGEPPDGEPPDGEPKK